MHLQENGHFKGEFLVLLIGVKSWSSNELSTEVLFSLLYAFNYFSG